MEGSWELSLRGLTDLPWWLASPWGEASLVDFVAGYWGNLWSRLRAASMKTSAQAEKRGGPWWDQGLAPRILAPQGMGKPASGREPASPRKGGGLIEKTHSCCL